MAKMTPEESLIVRELCKKFKTACKDHTVGQVMHALTVFTTDVFDQGSDHPEAFVEEITKFTLQVLQLHAVFTAAKENGDISSVH